MSAPRSLETNLLFLCGEVTHGLHRAITADFRKHKVGITVEQFSILVLLFYKDGINQQEISTRLNRDKTTIARVVSNMERGKIIVRATNDNDTRGKLIFLTAKGRSIQQRAIRHSGALYVKAMKGISKSPMTETVQVLNKIIRNIHEGS